MESIAAGRAPGKSPALPNWLLMAIMVGGHAMKHAYASGFLLLLPEIRLGLGLSNAAIGNIATARGLAGGLTNFPAGFLADRSSNRWPAILGLTMIVMGTFQYIMGSTGDYAAIVLCIIVVGAAISFWHPPAIAALSQRFAERRGFAIAMHGTGGSIGEALGPVAVGVLLFTLTWQGVLQFSFIPAMVTGLAVWLLARNVRGATGGRLTVAAYTASLRTLAGTPALRTVMLVAGITSMATSGFTIFLPLYLRIDLSYDPALASWFIFASQAAGIASQPVMGFLSDRFGRLAVVIPSIGILGVGILLVSVAPPGILLALSVLLVGAFQFPPIALFLAAAMDYVKPQMQATTVSLVYGISFLAGSISPLIAGRLADRFGVAAVFTYAGAMALLGATLLVLRRSTLGRVSAQ
ncbi:MAG: MFS transporter [Dehalococcoidia bacterium]|nr:MFS transporter [Dehalococcoidia bacterium]